MSALFPDPAARALNHVLRSAPLAMERLRKHAGRTAAFHVGPVTLAFTVQTTGEVTRAVPGAARDLEVRISPFLLARLAAGEEAAFREIDMQGDMELARSTSRATSRDAEEDLSRGGRHRRASHRLGRALCWRLERGRRALRQGAAESGPRSRPSSPRA